MDTNNVDHEHTTLGGPGELIGFVPGILGFHPADSLVVVIFGENDAATVDLMMRVDLPEPEQYEHVIDKLCGTLVWQQADAVVLIVVGGPDTLSHRDLLIACESRFAETGIRTTHKLWTESTTAGARWHCYVESDCSGVVTNTTPVDQVNGVHPSRADLVATLTPDDDDALSRRAYLLAAAAGADKVDAATLLQIVDAAVDDATCGELPNSDHHIVALSMALCDHVVRDACIVQPDEAHHQAAEQLWAVLTRATPAPERAEPACLLALSAYQHGNGVLATIALECAEAADPGHRLAEQIRNALILGCPPARMRHAAEAAGRSSRDSLTGGQP
ncbi:MAG TPA: DUF4192 domain-containing protein [Pseudonocardiaceae bacterium]|nr:DUF4192 domain-containing protein [Pseudonocardiaceae bacterium]